MFSPAQSTSHTIHKSTNIVFKKILCTINSDDGSASFNELSDIVHGFLHNQHFGKGSMKAAHEVLWIFTHISVIRHSFSQHLLCQLILSSGGHHGRHVAKRFFRVANDDAPSSPRHLGLGGIEIRAHNIYIQAECRRLLQGQWFLSAFYMLCAKSNVSVDDRTFHSTSWISHVLIRGFWLLGLQFADAFLLQEDTATTPSPASGAKSYTNETDGVMWLVEKRRPNSLIRFSGTLSHPSSNSDLRSSTIYALAHFSYGHSNKSLVFADLQGKVKHTISHRRVVPILMPKRESNKPQRSWWVCALRSNDTHTWWVATFSLMGISLIIQILFSGTRVLVTLALKVLIHSFEITSVAKFAGALAFTKISLSRL